MNLPDYNFLPAPFWLLTVLQLLMVTLHLAAMNFLVGGVIILLHARLENKWARVPVQDFVKFAPSAMAATVTLGVAALLFLQVVYPHQVYAASITSGWCWLLVIAAAIAAYYMLYAAAFSKQPAGQSKAIYLLLALVCFLYVSLVYSATFSLAERPELYKAIYARVQSGWILNPDFGSYGFRWLHMLAGAVTVGGFWIGLMGRKDEAVFQTGKKFFLWGMVIASLLGIVYLVSLSSILPPLMKSPAIWWLTGSILLTLGAMHLYFKRHFGPAGGMLFVSLLGMVTVRHYVRLIMLRGQYDPTLMRVSPQWSIFGVFIVCLLIAVALLIYMIRLYFHHSAEK